MNIPRPAKPIFNRTFSMRLTNDLTERVDAIASRNAWSRASLLRHFIVNGVRDLERSHADISPA